MTTTKLPAELPDRDIYFDNKAFLQELIVFKKACVVAKKKSQPKPQVPESLAKSLIMMADRMGQRGNFKGYYYLEEMKQDGILTCLKYISNFSPEISKNAFGFFSRIMWRAFVNRIKIEQKQQLMPSNLP